MMMPYDSFVILHCFVSSQQHFHDVEISNEISGIFFFLHNKTRLLCNYDDDDENKRMMVLCYFYLHSSSSRIMLMKVKN